MWTVAVDLQRLGNAATCADWAAFESLQAASIALEDALDFVTESDPAVS